MKPTAKQLKTLRLIAFGMGYEHADELVQARTKYQSAVAMPRGEAGRLIRQLKGAIR